MCSHSATSDILIDIARIIWTTFLFSTINTNLVENWDFCSQCAYNHHVRHWRDMVQFAHTAPRSFFVYFQTLPICPEISLGGGGKTKWPAIPISLISDICTLFLPPDDDIIASFLKESMCSVFNCNLRTLERKKLFQAKPLYKSFKVILTQRNIWEISSCWHFLFQWSKEQFDMVLDIHVFFFIISCPIEAAIFNFVDINNLSLALRGTYTVCNKSVPPLGPPSQGRIIYMVVRHLFVFYICDYRLYIAYNEWKNKHFRIFLWIVAANLVDLTFLKVRKPRVCITSGRKLGRTCFGGYRP